MRRTQIQPLVLLPALLLALALPAPAQKHPGADQAPRLPAGAPLEDCNGNGIPDIRDILTGTSTDCQADGVPDECQDDVEGIYLHDDWVLDGGAGWGFPHYAWLTAHYARPGQEVITEVELAWGQLPPGTPVTIGLWSDPDGDGKPYDAQVLVSVPAVAEYPFSGKLVRVDIPDTYVGPAGTPFFVGAYGAFDPSGYPLGYDYGVPSLQSWIVMSNDPIQPDDLQAGAVQFAILGDADWILRGTSCPSGHCGETTDGNFDGIPDQCQPQDCNSNGVPDDQDIALGTSGDCQLDGIPDECQLGSSGLVYAQDDGELDTAVGTNHSYYAWLNRFVVQPGGETVTDIEVAWGAALPGTEVTVGLWSDPNGDGDPTDAQLIQGFQTLTTYEFTGEWVSVNIPDTFVGSPGTSFFVGAYGFFEWDPTGAKPTWYAAGLDTDQPDLQAWFISADAPIDLDDLSAGAAEYGRLNTVCSCDGDWTIRAVVCSSGHCGESADVNNNGLPDECEADCDGDGLPDDYEIQVGLATDCNGNGLPDNCETLADCDGNALPDLCQSSAPDGLAGEYYATPDLSGDALARIDPQVLFDFVATPPFPGFPATGFSARWTGAVRAPAAGVYTFGLVHDDGARLWVNGRLVIDAWQTAPGTAFDTGTIELPAAGEYLVRLEYFQEDGGALMELHWQTPGGTLQPMLPSELRPIYDRNGDGVPDTCQLASDCNGNGVEDADDIASGISLDCDANGIPDDCQRCDDADGNGLLDSCELAGGPGLVGQYFRLDPDTFELAQPVFARVDAQVDFDWGSGAPVGLPTEAFGARWTGTLTVPGVSGDYTLSLQVDSGARLWLDGVLRIDGWGGPGTYSTSVNLAALTEHLLRVDYREAGGNASIELGWTVPGGSPQVLPASALAPDTDLNGDGVPDVALADCNLNGVPDALDPDVNGNCVPDDCEGGAGYWRFEEAGGATAVDETGNGLTGTIDPFYAFRTPEVPLAVIPQTGAANTQALDNGWIGYVTVPDVGGLLRVPNEGFTLEAWVQLDSLGFNNGNANARQWLFMKKPPASSDALLEYAFLVQSGDLGGSGRELAFRYGDGVGVDTVVSSLSIQDFEWHFVSVAYDAVRRELRFGLDGQFQTVPFSKPQFSNPGTLMLGAHENQTGQKNQWLFGRYDEPRFTRAFLPPEALLD